MLSEIRSVSAGRNASSVFGGRFGCDPEQPSGGNRGVLFSASFISIATGPLGDDRRRSRTSVGKFWLQPATKFQGAVVRPLPFPEAARMWPNCGMMCCRRSAEVTGQCRSPPRLISCTKSATRSQSAGGGALGAFLMLCMAARGPSAAGECSMNNQRVVWVRFESHAVDKQRGRGSVSPSPTTCQVAFLLVLCAKQTLLLVSAPPTSLRSDRRPWHALEPSTNSAIKS